MHQALYNCIGQAPPSANIGSMKAFTINVGKREGECERKKHDNNIK